jgi:hypothetical protein
LISETWRVIRLLGGIAVMVFEVVVLALALLIIGSFIPYPHGIIPR